MKRTITTIAFTAIAFAAIAFAAAGAHAQSGPSIEQAISITPAFTATTRTECTITAASAPSGGWLGPALGAILGGGAGSQVGKGSGQAAAAAIGATLGAQAGGAMSGNNSNGNTAPTQTCRDITERVLTGYTMRTSFGRDVFVQLQLVQQFNAANR